MKAQGIKRNVPRLGPCTIRRAVREQRHCPHLRLCSSWLLWRPSGDSPGRSAMPHPRWCRPSFGGKSFHWEPPPPDAYYMYTHRIAHTHTHAQTLWSSSIHVQTHIHMQTHVCMSGSALSLERPSQNHTHI